MIAIVGLYLLITQLYRLFGNWRGVPAAHEACVQASKATTGMVNTITPNTTIGMLTTMTTTITIITAIITRREKRAITSSMLGSLPGRYRGEKSWR